MQKNRRFERKVKDRNLYLLKRQRKDMTLIIGARCRDGVVLIADKKEIKLPEDQEGKYQIHKN